MENSVFQKNQSLLTINKLLSILLIFFIVIIVSEGLYYYFFIHKKSTPIFKSDLKQNQSSSTSTFKPQKEEKKYLEIAASTLDWLNQQKDDRGVYFFAQLYQSSEKKYENLPSGESGHYGLTTIWGRFKYFQATNDKKIFNLLKNDLNTYTDKNKVKYIQNDFWNCKLMYELWQSNLFSNKEKKLIENICWQRSSYLYPEELLQAIDGKTSLNKKEFVDLDLEKAITKQLIFDKPLNQDEINLIFNFFPYPSDFAFRYLWKKDEKDLKIARYYFYQLIHLFTEKEEEIKKHNAEGLKNFCLLGIDSLDLYKATNKKSYLKFALFLGEKILKEEKTKLKPPVCAFFANQLFKTTGKKEFEEIKKNLLDSLINQVLDLPSFPGNLTGKGGFLLDERGNPGAIKVIRENGLLVGLLSQ